MKMHLTLIAVCLIVLALTGCSPAGPSVTQQTEIAGKTAIAFNESNTVTVGNNTYIAINKIGIPSGYVEVILEIMKKFEESHPELIILDWKIENYYNSQGRDKLYGIWVHHKLAQ